MADEDDSGLLSAVKKKISTTPCLRDSLISGITGGFFAGFAAFILTSTQKRAINWGFGAGLGLFNIQFIGCKVKRREQEQMQERLKSGIREHLLREGTAEANPEAAPYILTETEGHVPLDELEQFERRASEKQALAASSPAPPPPPSALPETQTPACDCS